MNTSASSRVILRGLALLLAAGVLSPLEAQSRSAKGYEVSLARSGGVTQQLNFNLGDYSLEPFRAGNQTFTRINFRGNVVTDKKGFAELPFCHAALQIPADKKIRVIVESVEQEDIKLDHPIVPSRGVIYRNEDPTKIPFVMATEATRSGFYPAEVVDVTAPYIFRDVKGANLYFRPFQYNAATNTLRVTKSMNVRVEEVVDENEEALSLMSRSHERPVAEMDAAYQNLFLNYQSVATRFPNEIGDKGDLLVIYTSRDKTAIQPYIDYKKKQGFNVKGLEVAKGTNVKNTVKTEYEANKNLLYVQLVGDWADIQSPLGGGANKPMDPTLGWITGDSYAELIIGRFSATSAQQVTDQVNKTMGYDKEPAGDWIKSFLGIASSEGAGAGDDKQSDIQQMTAIQTGRLKPAGYTNYTACHGDNSTSAMSSGAVNKGLSVINYVGHGSETEWVTTSYNTKVAAAATNGFKLPVVCSVACVVGSFQSEPCLAEAMTRNPKGGALCFMGATINQPWTPPMRGQDYFNDLLAGGHTYGGGEAGTSTSNINKATFGSLSVNAHVLMYAESSGSSDLQTIQTWCNFGDVTVKVRTPKNPNPDNSGSGGDDTPNDDTPQPTQLVISGQPQSQSVEAGKSVTFNVGVTGGTAPYSYKWFKNGSTVSTSASYTFTSKSTDNNAKLYAVVSDSKGQSATSSTATLTVTTPQQATVSITPSSTTVPANGTYSFKASVSGSTNTSVRWSATGGTVSTSGYYTAPASAGTYRVRATSAADSTKYAEAVVTVTPVVVPDPDPVIKNLILNGDFEQGVSGWKGAIGSIASWGAAKPAFSGKKCAWLGGYGSENTESLTQTITIPADASSAPLAFAIKVETAENSKNSAYDSLEVQLVENGQVVASPFTFSNLDAASAYLEKEIDLVSYKGRTLQIVFKVTEDQSAQTSFTVDKISMMIDDTRKR